jgi:Uma2 family endonuclease
LGVFDQQRVELIEGELIDKTGKNRPHVNVAALLIGWFIQVFGARRVNFEAPIDVAPEDNPTNEPVPDMIVLTRGYSEFPSVRPQPRDLDLVIEIADTTLVFDFTTKASLYAPAGIVEYWLFDVAGRRLIVHCEPQGGQYGSVTSFGEDESVAPLSAASSNFLVGTVFLN